METGQPTSNSSERSEEIPMTIMTEPEQTGPSPVVESGFPTLPRSNKRLDCIQVQRAKHWCFTLNNPSDAEKLKVQQFCEKVAIYAIFALEHAPTTGTPHLQGYFNFGQRNIAMRQIINEIGFKFNRMHLEAARGSAKQNREYCSKEGIVMEFGICPIKGNADIDKQQRVDPIAKGLKLFPTAAQFALNAPGLYCRNCGGIERVYKYSLKQQQKVKPFVVWIAGPTGCGKTRFAMSFPGTNAIITDLPWINGYDGEDNVVLDDLRKGCMSFNKLLTLLDQYQKQQPVKGDFQAWNPKRIFITCPRLPEIEFQTRDHLKDGHGNWTYTVQEDLDQLTRRCDVIMVKYWKMGEPEFKDEQWSFIKGSLAQLEQEAQGMIPVPEPEAQCVSHPTFELEVQEPHVQPQKTTQEEWGQMMDECLYGGFRDDEREE